MKQNDKDIDTLLPEYLKKRGVPASLVKGEIHESLKDKFEKLISMLSDSACKLKTIILYGTDSIHKYIFAVSILKFYALKDKSVCYISASDIDDNVKLSAIYFVMGLETVTGYHVKKVQDFIRKQVINGCVMVLTCHEIEALEEIYGKDFRNLLSDNAIKVDTSVKHESVLDVSGENSASCGGEEQCQRD